jgi:hypothetical protein
MASRNKRKTRQAQRQRMRYRLIVAAGVSLAAISGGVLLWLQLSKPEESRAAVVMQLSQDALPADMNIEAMIVAPADTSNRGIKAKAMKPLSLTPELPAN